MKRILLLLIIPAIIIGLASCTNPASVVGIPTNLEWAVGTNGIDLTLSWTAVDDADGYIVITPAGDTVEPDTNTEYIFTDAIIGTYSVLAFASAEYGTAAILSNAPYEQTSAMTIYPLSSAHSSGFDITTSNGTADTVSMADSTNAANVDFYLDNSMYFASADIFLTFTCDNKTRFLDSGTNAIVKCDEYIPGTNYFNKEQAVSDHYYMVSFCETDATGPFYYGIIKDVIVTADNVSFKYKFQTLKGFRKF